METVGFGATGTTTLTNRFVRGPGVDEIVANFTTTGSTPTQYWAADERGSLVSLTAGSTGATTVINTYDEYGVPASGNLGRMQYTGQLWLPDFGGYHYKARMYQPGLGRFLQTDPIGYAGGANLYAYVGADPVNLVDPLGLQEHELQVPVAWLCSRSGPPGDTGRYFNGCVTTEYGYINLSSIWGRQTRYSGGRGGGGGSGRTGGPTSPPDDPPECVGGDRQWEVGRRAPGLADGYYGFFDRGASAVPIGGAEITWTDWRRVEGGITTEAFRTRSFSGLAGYQSGAGVAFSYSTSDPRGRSMVLNLSAGIGSISFQYSRESGFGVEGSLGGALALPTPKGLGFSFGGQSGTVLGCQTTARPRP